jgi:hypothetical protein
MREAPSISVASGLIDLHAQIRAYDPAGMDQARLFLPDGITWARSEYDAAEGADAVVVVTDWNQFRALDLTRMKRAMRAPVLIDLRNMYRVEDVTAHGFRYYRIGAPQLVPTSTFAFSGRPSSLRRRQRIEPTSRTNGATPATKSKKRLATTGSEVNTA